MRNFLLISGVFLASASSVWAQTEPTPDPSTRPASPLVSKWNRGVRQLKEIYRDGRLNETGALRPSFIVAASAYRARAPEAEKPEIDRLVKLVQTYQPLFYGDDERIIFGGNRGDRYSLKALQRVHGFELLAETALDPALAQQARELARHLGLPDPTQSEIARLTKLAGDHFLENSNGDGVLSTPELTVLFAYLYSSVVTSVQMAGEMVTLCGLTDPSREDSQMDSKCFRREVQARYKFFFKNLPRLIEVLDSSTAEDRSLYLDTILNIVGSPVEENRISVIRVMLANLVIHLNESLYARFDLNRDGVFDTRETAAIFPLFRQELTRLSGLDSAKWVEAAFTYVLRHGVLPDAKGWGLVRFVWWRFIKPFWRLNVSRQRVADVAWLVVSGGVIPRFEPWEEAELDRQLSELLDSQVSDSPEEIQRHGSVARRPNLISNGGSRSEESYVRRPERAR